MLLGNENGNERQNNVVSFTVDGRNKKFGTDLERMQNGKETRAAIEYWFDLLLLKVWEKDALQERNNTAYTFCSNKKHPFETTLC